VFKDQSEGAKIMEAQALFSAFIHGLGWRIRKK